MDLWGWFNCLLGATIGSALLLRGLGRSSPLSFKLLAIYCLLSMLSVVVAPEVRYPEASVILATFSAQAFVVFVCAIALFKWKPRISWKYVTAALVVAELLRLVYMGDKDSGFLRASTFSSSFFAATLFVIPIQLVPVSLLAIFVLGGFTAKAILATQVLYYLWFKRFYLVCALGSLSCVSYGASLYFSGKTFGGLVSRFEHWEMLWNFWSDKWSTIVFGTGFGTLEYLGFLIQRAMFYQWHPPKIFGANLSLFSSGEMFQRMHNDWYQTLFELGIIGFVLMVTVYWKILLRAWKTDKAVVGVWLGIGVWGLTYYPLHSPITVIFVALAAQKAWCKFV